MAIAATADDGAGTTRAANLPADQASKTAAGVDRRERFLPLTRYALMDRLTLDKSWPEGDAVQARRFMRYLDYWRRHSYSAELLDLEQTYEPFSPDSDLLTTRAFQVDEKQAMQKRLVAQSKTGFVERDMVVILVSGDRQEALIGEGPGESAEVLRQRFGVPPGAFRSILVGKDGGVKLSSGEPITAAALFSLIDQMPMRLQEMRTRPN